MSPGPRRSPVLGVVAAVVLLAALSTIAIAAASGAFRAGGTAPNGRCTAPHLTGTIVDVALMNMGGPMMGGWTGGAMRVRADHNQVPAGTVSLRVANLGSLVHELVVLPLTDSQRAGGRPVGSDGQVDETGSLGEASHSCGEGQGDGLEPGSLGWATLQLKPGNYELICNLPGHYPAGMYTELRVR